MFHHPDEQICFPNTQKALLPSKFLGSSEPEWDGCWERRAWHHSQPAVLFLPPQSSSHTLNGPHMQVQALCSHQDVHLWPPCWLTGGTHLPHVHLREEGLWEEATWAQREVLQGLTGKRWASDGHQVGLTSTQYLGPWTLPALQGGTPSEENQSPPRTWSLIFSNHRLTRTRVFAREKLLYFLFWIKGYEFWQYGRTNKNVIVS